MKKTDNEKLLQIQIGNRQLVQTPLRTSRSAHKFPKWWARRQGGGGHENFQIRRIKSAK